MNASRLTLIPLAIATASLLCMAHSAQAQASETPVSRAEVLADLHIWRQAGLHNLQGDAEDASRAEHIAAMARYRALRAAPEFAQLVARIERERADKRQVAAR